MEETRIQWAWLTIRSTFGTKVTRRVNSVYSIKHYTSGYWFLIPSQPQWLNLANKASSGTSSGREVIPMFSPFKNITIHIVLATAGALFGMRRTSAFHISVVVMGNWGRVGFGPCAMRKLGDFFLRTTRHTEIHTHTRAHKKVFQPM